MTSLTNQLLNRQVAEVMSREVVTVSANATMAEASQVLLERGVSGAPVVNEFGKCVGVLSWTDFARRDQGQSESESLSVCAGEFELGRDDHSGVLHIERVVEGFVHQHMSSAIQSIDSQQTLWDAARYLHAEHIHRLIVLDSSTRPVGVLSALDIIGACIDSGGD